MIRKTPKVWLKGLALATVVFACATATAASGGAFGHRNQSSAVATAGGDSDHDGLSDAAEVGRYHTDPRRRDTDSDGLKDGAEVRRYHTDPRRRDTDHDGLKDGAEVYRYHTNPRRGDTDRDGLKDGVDEVGRYHTDPRRRDTDRDGLFDGDEVRRYHTNPRERDSDGDGYGDGAEVRAETNPLDRRNRPGFPAADNTGVPPETVLSTYSGPSTISTSNTVIDGKTMGCIAVSATGVVIRNSRISCGSDYNAVQILSGSLTIEDSEIECQNRNANAVSGSNVTVRRVNIFACENGLDFNGSSTVEDSYIHDLYTGGGAHTDGIQLNQGADSITVRHNTIDPVPSGSSGATSCIIMWDEGDPQNSNVLIENNRLLGDGAAATIYTPRQGPLTNVRVRNNRLARGVFTYNGGSGSLLTDGSGNVDDVTGRPLSL